MIVSPAPPDGWSRRVTFFDQSGWCGVVEKGFGCQTLYVADQGHAWGICASVFSLHGFRIAYCHFPVGCRAIPPVGLNGMLSELAEVLAGEGVDLIRFSVQQDQCPDHPLVRGLSQQHETIIPNLASWELSGLSKHARRDANRSEREGFACRQADSEEDARLVFDIYRTTIARRSGNLRYTLPYFMALVEQADRSSELAVLLAERKGKVYAAMTLAIDGDTAFYLHGGNALEVPDPYAGDFLMLRAIEWAKSHQATRFNMLASSANQPGLVRYKEKWGGVSLPQWSFNMPVSTKGRLLSRLLQITAYLKMGI